MKKYGDNVPSPLEGGGLGWGVNAIKSLRCYFKLTGNLNESLHLDFYPQMLLNVTMSDEINKKIISIFSKHKNSQPLANEDRVKFFAGFNYVKMNKDNNGKKFNAEQLEKYAQECHYIVRVMRNINDEIILYNYDVPNNQLFRFIKAFENNTLNGVIIEIDKYFPEDLA